ncbi:MAG TPA: hypothetical protein VHB50_18155 [Bryobacteraceae bacterium]|nr:hypothetical protein [Bryobacteraceae bacterium]
MTPATAQKKHQVHIHAKDGGLRYAKPGGENAHTIEVTRGDRISWRCDHGNFAVLFKQHSPFSAVALHGHKGTDSEEGVVTGAAGSYHYAVTVAVGDQVLTDDPVVIVNDGD